MIQNKKGGNPSFEKITYTHTDAVAPLVVGRGSGKGNVMAIIIIIIVIIGTLILVAALMNVADDEGETDGGTHKQEPEEKGNI